MWEGKRGMSPTSLTASGLRLRGALAMALIVCGLLHAGRGFIASPAGDLGTTTGAPPQLAPRHGRTEAAGTWPSDSAGGLQRGSAAPSMFAQASWSQLSCLAIGVVCAARALASGSRKGVRARSSKGCRLSVVCRAQAAQPAVPPPSPATAVVQEQEKVAAFEPLINLSSCIASPAVPTQVRSTSVATAASAQPPSAAPAAPAAAKKAAWVGGARRSRSRRLGSARRAAAAAARSAAKHVGARLQTAAASRSEVPAPSFDISRVRSQIQLGLQVVSGTSASHSREHKSPKMSSAGGAEVSSVRSQTRFLLVNGGGQEELHNEHLMFVLPCSILLFSPSGESGGPKV